jgi:hypothetical protein
MKTKLIAVTIILAVAIVICPKAMKQNSMSLNSVHTDAKTTYPLTLMAHGAWFCEAVQ